MPKIPVYPLKILVAVGLPAILAVAVCLAATTIQRSTGKAASALADAAFGRAEAAARLERQTLLTAHHLRGYALTGERHFLEEAKKELATALTRMQELKAAAIRTGDVAFVEEAERVSWLVESYKKAAEAIVGQNEVVAEARTAFEAAGDRFVDLADAFSARKKAALIELAVKYPPGTLVRAVSDRIFHAQNLALAAREVLAAEAQAGRARKPEMLRSSLARLDELDSHVNALHAQASEEDAKAASELAATLDELRKAADRLAREWELLHASGRTLALAERDALGAASTAVENASVVEHKGMESFASELVLQKSLLWTLLAVTVSFAVVWIILAVRYLGIPVFRCAAFAQQLAGGRVPRGLAVSGRDEVGVLAESLRELSRRFGRSFAR
jgi:CHASE3 domain sensor protein